MHLGSAQPEACASRVLPPEVLPSGVHGAAITEIVKRTGESLFVSDDFDRPENERNARASVPKSAKRAVPVGLVS